MSKSEVFMFSNDRFVGWLQCDQIGRYIGLWTTFQSLWQQLICPNLLRSQAIFVKVSKSITFLVKSFLGNFYRHWRLFTGHTGQLARKNGCQNTCCLFCRQEVVGGWEVGLLKDRKKLTLSRQQVPIHNDDDNNPFLYLEFLAVRYQLQRRL